MSVSSIIPETIAKRETYSSEHMLIASHYFFQSLLIKYVSKQSKGYSKCLNSRTTPLNSNSWEKHPYLNHCPKLCESFICILLWKFRVLVCCSWDTHFFQRCLRIILYLLLSRQVPLLRRWTKQEKVQLVWVEESRMHWSKLQSNQMIPLRDQPREKCKEAFLFCSEVLPFLSGEVWATWKGQEE